MPTEVLDIFSVPDYATEIERAAKVITDGGLVVLPTETVYGAAALLTSAIARQRLKELRGSVGAGRALRTFSFGYLSLALALYLAARGFSRILRNGSECRHRRQEHCPSDMAGSGPSGDCK